MDEFDLGLSEFIKYLHELENRIITLEKEVERLNDSTSVKSLLEKVKDREASL